MYDVFIIVALPVLWVLLNISSFLIIFLYELGHAVPALIYSQKPVSIYIGTYGDNAGRRYSIAKLSIYIRPKFNFLKSSGLCVFDAGLPLKKRINILLAAPVTMGVVVFILLEAVFFSEANIYLRMVPGVVLLTAVICLVVKLFPLKLKVKNSDRLFYSDGYQLILLLESKKNYDNLSSACNYYDRHDYENALKHLLRTEGRFMDESIFGLILACYIQLKQYTVVEPFHRQYEAARWYEGISARDYYLLACANIQLKRYNQALVYLDQSILLDAKQFDSFYNRGFVHIMLQNHLQAKEDLNKAIFYNDAVPNAYCSRAITSLELGRPGEALIDIEKAIVLDENNSYAHLMMGMYQRVKGNGPAARASFERAKALDANARTVDDYIAGALQKLPQAK